MDHYSILYANKIAEIEDAFTLHNVEHNVVEIQG